MRHHLTDRRRLAAAPNARYPTRDAAMATLDGSDMRVRRTLLQYR
jgi:hypothetical protein